MKKQSQAGQQRSKPGTTPQPQTASGLDPELEAEAGHLCASRRRKLAAKLTRWTGQLLKSLPSAPSADQETKPLNRASANVMAARTGYTATLVLNADANRLLRRINREAFGGKADSAGVALWVLSLALLNRERTVRGLKAWAAWRSAEGFSPDDSFDILKRQLAAAK